ncbi:TetR/AcrR family transcriptional regulator [Nocardiopsis sediminis]|uniref:TetR/AcrR family transcriptional regulator n=1 Tax=Nocardiopsis sediminis TaxID=1778267 RepID=A0ABV8FU39_9ACTN
MRTSAGGTGRDGTRLRADARRNRELIIAAARELIAERGPDVPMEEIARAAGVGVGTLYRRFPDRESLLVAVAGDNYRRVAAEVRNFVREGHGAWHTLRSFLSHASDVRLSLRLAFFSERTFSMLKHDAEARRSRDELLATLERLVRDAQTEGSMRTDVGAGDVVVLIGLFFDPARRARLPLAVPDDRYLMLMFDALHSGNATPLPGPPLGTDVLVRQLATDDDASPTPQGEPSPDHRP